MVQQVDSRPYGVVREFFGGFAVLGQGFTYWRRRPGLMLLGLVPGLIVGIVMIGLLVLLGFNLAAISELLTGFAEGWDYFWVTALRVVTGIAVFAAALILTAFAFTALTLLAGEPVYARIWREVEVDLGDKPEPHEPGFWRSVLDAGRLVVQAIVLAIVIAIISLVPFVGVPIAAVLGFFLSGRILAVELTTRPLEARGMTRQERTRILRTRNPRLIGFGVAVHFFFAIPLGAVLVMPAAVAGATILARHALESGKP